MKRPAREADSVVCEAVIPRPDAGVNHPAASISSRITVFGEAGMDGAAFIFTPSGSGVIREVLPAGSPIPLISVEAVSAQGGDMLGTPLLKDTALVRAGPSALVGTPDMQDDPIGGQPPDDTPSPTPLDVIALEKVRRDVARAVPMRHPLSSFENMGSPSVARPLDGGRAGTGPGGPDSGSVLPTSEGLLQGTHQAIDRLADIRTRRERALRDCEEAVTD